MKDREIINTHMKKTILIIFILVLPLTAGAARLAPGSVPEQEPLQPIPVDVAPNLKESANRIPEQENVEDQPQGAGINVGLNGEKRVDPERCVGSDGVNRCVGVPLEPKKNFPIVGYMLLGVVGLCGIGGAYLILKRGEEEGEK